MPRYTIDFNEKQEKILDELAEEFGVTKAEVLRKAITLLKIASEETGEDKKLSITSKEDKVIKDIILK